MFRYCTFSDILCFFDILCERAKPKDRPYLFSGEFAADTSWVLGEKRRFHKTILPEEQCHALLSHICYLKEQTFEIYDKEGDHKVNLIYNFSNTFFGRSAFTGVWVGVILAFLPWVQVEPRADVNDLPPSLPLCPCVRHCTSSSRQSFPRSRWEGRECKWAPSSNTFHFLQVVFNPELSWETLSQGALYLKKYLSLTCWRGH